MAVKNFIDVGAGVVDYDYRGNVGVVLFNHRYVCIICYCFISSRNVIFSTVRTISKSREVIALLN